MNWQAMLAGDKTVSKMIKSLGILLDHSIDRTNRKLISLSEELKCANAYLYLISMRFGQNLTIEKNVDEDLLDVQVPQLILQPLLENSVVHGIERVRNGVIKLDVYREDKDVILQIANTGNGVRSDDIKYVRDILDGKENTQAEGKHKSIGIRNVNERIQLIYGEQYGLSIALIEETGEVVCKIQIPYEIQARKSEMKISDFIK